LESDSQAGLVIVRYEGETIQLRELEFLLF